MKKKMLALRIANLEEAFMVEGVNSHFIQEMQAAFGVIATSEEIVKSLAKQHKIQEKNKKKNKKKEAKAKKWLKESKLDPQSATNVLVYFKGWKKVIKKIAYLSNIDLKKFKKDLIYLYETGKTPMDVIDIIEKDKHIRTVEPDDQAMHRKAEVEVT